MFQRRYRSMATLLCNFTIETTWSATYNSRMLDRTFRIASQGSPGERLRAIRLGLGINTRSVERYSVDLARTHDNPHYRISHNYLTKLENLGTTPGIYKLFTISIIYKVNYTDLLYLYGIDLDEASKSQITLKLPKTHLIDHRIYDAERPVTFPVKFDPGARIGETNLLSRMVETWGEIPLGFAQHLSLRKHMYGFIGMDDYTAYPFIRPGSLVQIDDHDTKIAESGWDNEFERPIYFLQLRTGYACGWCERQGKILTLTPHNYSRMPIRRFEFPNEVDVIGRVAGVAMSMRQQLRPGRPLLTKG